MSLQRSLAPARKYWEESGLILLFISSLVALSTFCAFFVLAPMSAPSDALNVHWLIILVGFAVVETFVVNLHFRSESGSFSLLEIPLVIGLLFSPPLMLWLAIILGAGFSLAFVRRLPLLKLLFNVANLSLHVAVAAVLFGWLVGDGDPLAPLGWLALFVTTLVASFVEVGGIGVVIALSERRIEAIRLKNMMLFGALVALANTLQALIGVLVVRVDPWGSALLLGSMAVLFLAYRGYVSERDHRERVEFLYESTRSLHESSEKTAAIGHLLDEAASMFRASTVELVLFPPPDSDDPGRRYRYENGKESDQDIDDISKIAALAIRCEAPQLALDGTTTFDLAEHLHSIEVTDALVGTLRSEQRTVGLLVVGDRLGTVTTFTEDDLRLFENLVQQSAVALENDQLEQALTRLRKLEGELSHQARYDQLTGLANRNLFGRHVDDTIQSWRSVDPSQPLNASLLYIDLDDFKLVNDRLGHAAGDVLLSEVARRIESVLGPDDLPARLGGDEFAVMLGGTVEPEQIAHQIIGVLTAPFNLEGAEARIGASVGVAIATRGIDSSSRLLKHADLAMYEAKQRGKGSVVRYSAELESLKNRQQALHTSLRKAISDEAFEAMYQPIVRLDDLSIVGAEALVRWRQDDGEILTPGAFIEEAERSGLIISIDRLLRVCVLDDLPSIQAIAPADFWVSLNISARHLLQPSFVADFRHDVNHANIDPGSLVVEVTESVFAGDTRAAAAALADLKSTNARVALDDFGTGYSSLSYLRDLPIDIVKIAQPFVADLTAASDLAFVHAITTLAHGLSMKVVAEGIEENTVLESLRSVSCEFGQGFLFGRPMTADALKQRLDAQQSRFEAA